MRRGRPRAEAGFTLIELTVAMVLMIVALLLATDVLMESHTIFAEVARDLREPPLTQIVGRLRADVQAARSASGVPGLGGRLDLTITGVGVVRYGLVEGQLLRTVFRPGIATSSAPILYDVTSWLWTQPSPQLLQIQIARRRHATPRGSFGLERLRQGMRSIPEVVTIDIQMRGGGKGNQW